MVSFSQCILVLHEEGGSDKRNFQKIPHQSCGKYSLCPPPPPSNTIMHCNNFNSDIVYSKIVNFPLAPFNVERSQFSKSFNIETRGRGFQAFFVVVRIFFTTILDFTGHGTLMKLVKGIKIT